MIMTLTWMCGELNIVYFYRYFTLYYYYIISSLQQLPYLFFWVLSVGLNPQWVPGCRMVVAKLIPGLFYVPKSHPVVICYKLI